MRQKVPERRLKRLEDRLKNRYVGKNTASMENKGYSEQDFVCSWHVSDFPNCCAYPGARH